MTTAPYVSTSDTSYAAAKSLKSERLQRLEQTVLWAITARGGATCETIEDDTGLSHQCASARCSEMAKRGVIRDSGQRGVNRSGRKAAIYVVA